MHNTRVRANQVAWSSGAVTPAELDKLDAGQFASINGDLGGVWAPIGGPIEIGGAGLLVSGPFESSGDADFDGVVAFHDDVDFEPNTLVTVRGDARFGTDAGDTITLDGVLVANEDATFGGDVVIDVGTTLTVRGDAQIGTDPGDDISFGGTSTFDAPATFNHSVTFTDPVAFDDSVAFSDDVDFEPGTLVTIRGDARFGTDVGDDITVDGTATFNEHAFFEGSTTFNGTMNVHASMNLGDTTAHVIDVGGSLQLNHPMRYAGSGRVQLRAVAGPDADHTYTVDECNAVHVTALTNSWVYTISDAGAVPGDFFEISLDGGATGGFSLDVRGPTGLLATLTATNDPETEYVKVVRVGNTWRVTDSSRRNPR